MTTAREQGQQAAKEWIAASSDSWFPDQPENPFQRPATYDAWKQPSDYVKWSLGFDAVCYAEWGDVDADTVRAEMRAGC